MNLFWNLVFSWFRGVDSSAWCSVFSTWSLVWSMSLSVVWPALTCPCDWHKFATFVSLCCCVLTAASGYKIHFFKLELNFSLMLNRYSCASENMQYVHNEMPHLHFWLFLLIFWLFPKSSILIMEHMELISIKLRSIFILHLCESNTGVPMWK